MGVPDEIFVSYRAAFPEIHVVLKGTSDALVQEWSARAQKTVGLEFVITTDLTKGLDEVVGELLKEKSLSVAVAESCTGGGIGQALTRIAGASAYFKGGDIVYTPEAKCARLGVSPATIATFEVVSAEVVREMAIGARKNFNSTYGLSITGALGPTGGTEKSPVGTFFLGIATESSAHAYQFFLLQERSRIARYAVWQALEVLRRTILGLPIEEVRPLA